MSTSTQSQRRDNQKKIGPLSYQRPQFKSGGSILRLRSGHAHSAAPLGPSLPRDHHPETCRRTASCSSIHDPRPSNLEFEICNLRLRRELSRTIPSAARKRKSHRTTGAEGLTVAFGMRSKSIAEAFVDTESGKLSVTAQADCIGPRWRKPFSAWINKQAQSLQRFDTENWLIDLSNEHGGWSLAAIDLDHHQICS